MGKLKNAWKSWTVWFNTAALSLIPVLDYAAANISQVRDFMDISVYKTIGLVIVVTNLALRFKTNTDLADK